MQFTLETRMEHVDCAIRVHDTLFNKDTVSVCPSALVIRAVCPRIASVLKSQACVKLEKLPTRETFLAGSNRNRPHPDKQCVRLASAYLL